jgi:hypothetical protein
MGVNLSGYIRAAVNAQLKRDGFTHPPEPPRQHKRKAKS